MYVTVLSRFVCSDNRSVVFGWSLVPGRGRDHRPQGYQSEVRVMPAALPLLVVRQWAGLGGASAFLLVQWWGHLLGSPLRALAERMAGAETCRLSDAWWGPPAGRNSLPQGHLYISLDSWFLTCPLFSPPQPWACKSQRACPGGRPLVVTSGVFLSSRGQHALPSAAHQLRLWRPTERGRGPHWEVFCSARRYSEGGCLVRAAVGWSGPELALDTSCSVGDSLVFKRMYEGRAQTDLAQSLSPQLIKTESVSKFFH